MARGKGMSAAVEAESTLAEQIVDRITEQVVRGKDPLDAARTVLDWLTKHDLGQQALLAMGPVLLSRYWQDANRTDRHHAVAVSTLPQPGAPRYTGDTLKLSPLERQIFCVEGQWKQAKYLTRKDCLWLASDYRQRASANATHAAMWTRIARRLKPGQSVGKAFTDAEWMAMFQDHGEGKEEA